MIRPIPVKQTPMSELDAAVAELWPQLKPAQTEKLRVEFGFSRNSLDRVLRQDRAKKQLWITAATQVLTNVSVPERTKTGETPALLRPSPP